MTAVVVLGASAPAHRSLALLAVAFLAVHVVSAIADPVRGWKGVY